MTSPYFDGCYFDPTYFDAAPCVVPVAAGGRFAKKPQQLVTPDPAFRRPEPIRFIRALDETEELWLLGLSDDLPTM